jgi:RHH-type transcriptional regulator, rel operon repressor / antitoxin RelB
MPRRCGLPRVRGKYTARARQLRRERFSQECAVRRTAENKLRVVAVRVDPAIEARLRVLAEVTGRKQSFFLQQMIENGIAAIEETWLSPERIAQARSGALQPRQPSDTTDDLFSDLDHE